MYRKPDVIQPDTILEKPIIVSPPEYPAPSGATGATGAKGDTGPGGGLNGATGLINMPRGGGIIYANAATAP